MKQKNQTFFLIVRMFFYGAHKGNSVERRMYPVLYYIRCIFELVKIFCVDVL